MTGGRTVDVPTGEPKLPECPAHPELIAEGWVRRFLVGPDRQLEVTELYVSLGHEVRLEQLQPQALGEKCGDCAEAVCRSYRLLYTRSSRV